MSLQKRLKMVQYTYAKHFFPIQIPSVTFFALQNLISQQKEIAHALHFRKRKSFSYQQICRSVTSDLRFPSPSSA